MTLTEQDMRFTEKEVSILNYLFGGFPALPGLREAIELHPELQGLERFLKKGVNLDEVACLNKMNRALKRSTNAQHLWASEEGRRNIRLFYAELCNRYQTLLSISSLNKLGSEQYLIDTPDLRMVVHATSLPYFLKRAFWPEKVRGESGHIATLQRELLESGEIRLGNFEYNLGLDVENLKALSPLIEKTHEYWSIHNTFECEPLLTRMIIGARLLSEFSTFPSWKEVTGHADHLIGVVATKQLRHFQHHTEICDVLELKAGTKRPFDGPAGLKRLERYISAMAKAQGHLLSPRDLKLLCDKHHYDTVRKSLKHHGYADVYEFQADLMRLGKLEFQNHKNQGALRIDPGKRGTFGERLIADVLLSATIQKRLRELGLEPTVDAQCYVNAVDHTVDFVVGQRFIVEVMGGVTSEQMFGSEVVPESRQFVRGYITNNRNYLKFLRRSGIPNIIIGMEDCETNALKGQASQKLLRAFEYYFDNKPIGDALEYECKTDVACDYTENGLAHWLQETPFFAAGSRLLPSRKEFELVSYPKWTSAVGGITRLGTNTICELAGLHYESRLPVIEDFDLNNPKSRVKILESHFAHLDHLPRTGYWHTSLKPLAEFYRRNGYLLANADIGKPWLTAEKAPRGAYKGMNGKPCLEAIAETLCSLQLYALGHPLFPSRSQLEVEGKSGAYRHMMDVLEQPKLKKKLCKLTHLMMIDDFLDCAKPIALHNLHKCGFEVSDNLEKSLARHLSREACNEWRMRQENRFSNFFINRD